MANVNIRNNGAGLYSIGETTILPGMTKTFTAEQLAPYAGNKALLADFKSRRLDEVADEAEAPAMPDLFTQQPKPDPLPGEKTPVNVQDAAAMAAFLQSGQPVPAK